jgi:hypothetical protein
MGLSFLSTFEVGRQAESKVTGGRFAAGFGYPESLSL